MKKTGINLSLLIKDFPDCRFIGNSDLSLTGVIAFRDIGDSDQSSMLSWVNDKYASTVQGKINLGLLILSENSFNKLKDCGCNLLITEDPRRTFANVLEKYFVNIRQPGIEQSSHIHPSVTLGAACYIGRNVVIEEGCIIGSSVEILHNTVLLNGTRIGDHVKIGCNNTIGNYGFGYQKDEKGSFQVVPHIGNVVIHDRVEIGNNNCIDRAVVGSTIIHKNTKIDNLVHIAHGVIIGENSLIIANVMIGGSTIIGKNCWIGPSTSILNGISIADETYTGMGAVITKAVTQTGQTMVGNPAVSIEEARKWAEVKKKLISG